MAEFIESVVKSNKRLDEQHFILQVSHKESGAYPGQFYMLRCWQDFPVLPRPISVFDKAGDSIFFFIRKKGEGTERLSQLRKGDKLFINGPLGKGYEDCDGFLAIGAGMGFASVHYAMKRYELDCVYGVYGSSMIFEFDLIKNISICTEDGSRGFCGNLIEYLKKHYEKDKYNGIIACGPDGFLDALIDYSRKEDIPLKVSYEERMGCGFGMCMSCSKEINGKKYHICKDGPVIDIETKKHDDPIDANISKNI